MNPFNALRIDSGTERCSKRPSFQALSGMLSEAKKSINPHMARDRSQWICQQA